MAEFGVTADQLAAVAVKNKRNGLDNPRAQLRAVAPTIEEVLGFPDDRRTADAAAVLPDQRRCGRGGHRPGPRPAPTTCVIEASAMVSGVLWDQRSDEVWGYASVARAAEKAFAQAGRTPAEIDVLEVHDAFTIGEIITLEALGLAPRGKGAELAPSGHTGSRRARSRSTRAAACSHAGTRSARPDRPARRDRLAAARPSRPAAGRPPPGWAGGDHGRRRGRHGRQRLRRHHPLRGPVTTTATLSATDGDSTVTRDMLTLPVEFTAGAKERDAS